MADKKNIVIKVSYPVAGSPEESLASKTITLWNVKRIMFAGVVLIVILVGVVYLFTGDDQQQVDVPSVKLGALSEKITGSEMIVNGDDNLEETLTETKEPEITLPPNGSKIVARINNVPVMSGVDINEKNQINSSKDKRAVDKQAIVANKIVPSAPNKNVSRALLVRGVNGKEPAHAMAGVIKVSKANPVPVYYFTELKAMGGKKVYHQWLQNGKTVAKYELPVLADRWRTYSHRVLAGKSRGHWLVRLMDEKGHVLNEQTFTAK
ncbi:MAG: DUF2914 domain-containing protein [Methylovulum sp.]|nr:DUF2914 domain-containing protein [Methylovulum sp.]